MVLDGEVVCLDESGYPQFTDLLFHRAEPCFFAFDVLFLEGYDLRNNALIERKAELRRLLSGVPLSSRMRYVKFETGTIRKWKGERMCLSVIGTRSLLLAGILAQ